ncbi:MAG: AAA family ATPase, partial [Lachnospiraceae bacterium]|nr:AAA family ATPase [Lachnospiraceae bacterium]
HEDAVALLKGEVWKRLSDIPPVLSLEELKDIQTQTERIFTDDSIYEYIVNLVEDTRSNPLFALGASPRAGIALLRMSRAMAMLAGRDFVTAKDVQSVLCDVLCHRVRLSARSRAEGVTAAAAVGRLLETVRCPKL